jgi:carboxyl-terminal processing protease
MGVFSRALSVSALLGAFALSTSLALRLHGGGLWDGLATRAAAASAPGAKTPANYDLSQLRVANDVIRTVKEKYVDPKRIKPREMLLSALNYVQREVAQVIVTHEENAPTVKVRVDTQEKEFRVDNVQGAWDVAARLREVFSFLQEMLRNTDVDLREIEYAACNGMLHTLDPHSVLLSPEAYKEMKLSTSGQFGGLGIVISIRDQQLTVINPMPGTPAARVGLKKYDRILQINNEPTLNMALQDAVNRLRGEPGTAVKIHVKREGSDGWGGTKEFTLTREVIKVASVESKLLEGNIGYVRLKQFQSNTAADLAAALSAMKKGGELKGLVLDLRGNPGGLLEQAARVVDKFIADGPIVATVGSPSEGREEKSATAKDTEPSYPMAVLVSGTSASASEIVAGALKNHDRAVVVGETTFGKGSVQLIFDDLQDKAALKLTIAQYLTEPGDISIQGTGVTPDIELDPMTVDPLEMDLTVEGQSSIKEKDLTRALSSTKARDGQRPVEVLRYHMSLRDRLEMRERGGDPDDVETTDFAVRFARDLVAKSSNAKRVEQLRALKGFVADVRAAELGKVSADLAKLGIDWSDAPGEVPASAPGTVNAAVDVKLETDRPNNEATAGEPLALTLTVTNKGTVPLYRLYGVTKSDNGLFDNRELVVGKLDPGKTRTVVAPLGWCEIEGRKFGSTAPLPKDPKRTCKIPKGTLSRADGIRVRFEEARGRAPAEVDTRVTLRALERPMFAYSYHVTDNRKGNGDGRVQKGEAFTMFVTIKNVGRGPSWETSADLSSRSGDGLFLRDGRFDVSNMKPGEVRRVAFTFDVQPQLADSEARLDLVISDRDLNERVVERVRLPVRPTVNFEAATGWRRAKAGAVNVFASPDSDGRVVGVLPAGGTLSALGQTAEWVKVAFPSAPGRYAFVRAADVDASAGTPAPASFDETALHAAPFIDLQLPPLATRDGKTRVTATATDDIRVLDAFVLVGSRKVFYQSNRNGNDPKRMSFETDVLLKPGVNAVVIVARENPETVSRRVFVVRRDGPNGELLQTPKLDDELSEASDFGDGD